MKWGEEMDRFASFVGRARDIMLKAGCNYTTSSTAQRVVNTLLIISFLCVMIVML